MSEENKKIKKHKPAVFDPKNLTDDQIGQVFSDERLWKHPRFKELNDQAKLAKDLLQKEEDAKAKKLEEEKKFDELLNLEREKNKKLTEQLSSIKVDSAIQTEAVKNGIVDPDAALKLVDRGLIKTGDNGEPVGITDAIKALVTSKPYLVDPKKANLGSGNPPIQTSTKIKLSDAQNPDYYRTHQKEVDEAFRTGNIEKDVPTGGPMNQT